MCIQMPLLRGQKGPWRPPSLGHLSPGTADRPCALSLAALWIWAQPVPTRLMAFSATLFSSPPAPWDWSHTQGAPVNLEAFCLYHPFAPSFT